jgi:outer membrane protein OmpA-like peptidoglycan-associated protein
MNGILRAGVVSGYHCHRQTGRVQLMAFFGCGRQPRDAAAFVQATVIPAWLRRMPVLVLACTLSVGGCSDNPSSGPLGWWNSAVGGKIAEQRPPPPGNNDPYPNLATVPPKPPAANTAEWNQRTTGLTTDRIKADQTAALAPIPPPVAASASPGAGLPPPTAPNQEPAASAALVGVTSPQPAKGPGASNASAGPSVKTPRGTNAQAPDPAGASGAGVATGTATATNTGLSTAQRVANSQLPALPNEAPPRPGIAPPPPAPLVPATVTAPFAAPAVGTEIDFPQNSAALNDPALAEIKALAAERGDRGIAITGYGGATSSDPVVQSDAVSLGLSRAQALATALVAQGVPYAMLRLNAEAAGRGASLRLLQ